MSDLLSDAMRVTARGEVREDFDQCGGFCHEIGDDDCARCGSGLYAAACDDCRFYMAQDAEVIA